VKSRKFFSLCHPCLKGGCHRSDRGDSMLWLIRFYQKNISPLTKPSCRFYPSCSGYAYEAIQIHGNLKGTWLAVCRLLKCHPFHRGGYDPVPERKTK